MFALKDYITSEDIKNLRKNLGLTQKEFASLVGTSKPTIERWEKENAKITGPIVLLSKMINDYPDYVNRLIIPEKEFPVFGKWSVSMPYLPVVNITPCRIIWFIKRAS